MTTKECHKEVRLILTNYLWNWINIVIAIGIKTKGDNRMSIDNRKLQKEIKKLVTIGYQIYLPNEYEKQKEKEWPLILFLHGINRRGEDIHLLDEYGLTWMAERKQNFEFIVISPQCPSLSSWPMERDAVITLLDEIMSTHRVDRESIYLTGFSMGGNGAWELAAFAPERFAAVAPIAGWFDVEKAALLGDMPIWTFHGEEDDIVPITGSKKMVDALRAMEKDISFTTFPGLKHNIMNETYENPDLYKWMLRHKRRSL
jgi:predicted peptidase